MLNESPTQPATEDYAAMLSRFAQASSVSTLPADAIAAAKVNLFDTLACAAAGSSAAVVPDARALALEWGGTAQASTLVFGDRLPAHHAAWVNGTMAHARDFDDTHDAAVLHAGVTVVPAALAAAELAGVTTGADLIAGIAVGLETVCRLGIATQIGIIESGFIYTPLFGHFGATLAAARVLRLDQTETVNALGIAYSQVAGNHQVTRDAAHTKRVQPGFAAMSALISVQMARRGVRGAQATFDGVDGFFRVYLRDRVDGKVLREGLGERFEFTQLSYKPYPCCRFNHTAIGAALFLRASRQIPVNQIHQIRVGLNHQAYEAVCTPVDMRKAPRTVVQAQFSVPYTVAVAIIDGAVRLGHFCDDALTRQDVLALASKVETYVDADIERQFGRSISPAIVTVLMQDGSNWTERMDLPLGHPSHPMSGADLEEKARDCLRASARPLGEGASSHLRKLIDAIETLNDVRHLMDTLQAAE